MELIKFYDLSYYYPDSSKPVLDHISLDISEGEFVLVIGPSGSGKSTLLRCLNGLVPHFTGGRLAGRVQVAGRDPADLGPRGMSDLVGFVLQDPEAQFVADVVEDELAFGMENLGLAPPIMRKRIEEVLDQLDIAGLRHRRVSSLSGGERQRVAIAAVLTLQPRVLVLDEPTSQLDPQAAEEVLTVLHQLNHDLGLTVILSEHRLERVLQFTDRVIYLRGNGVPPVIGSPRRVIAHSDLAPPLVRLGRELGWDPLPLTLKEARRFVSPACPTPPQPPPMRGGRGGGGRQHSIPTSPACRLDDVWFAYNGHPVLNGVQLEINQGEVIALMGRNGSGKTTLLKHIVGLLGPCRGRVEVLGRDLRGLEVAEIIQHVGYVPQNPNSLLFAETVCDEVAFTRRNHGLPTEAPVDLLAQFGLSALKNAYPRDLSVGERQRVALAAILAAEPEILLLDEPTRGLDYLQKQALTAFLRAQQAAGRTIVLATHDVELVATCADRVVLMGDGEIVVDGPTRQVMTESMVFTSQVNKLYREPGFLTVEDVIPWASACR